VKKLLLSIVFALISPVAFADQPSDDSIRELMEITDSRQLMEGAMAQADQMMRAAMEQTIQGHDISSADRKVLDDMREKMVALLQEELSWASMEPMFIQIYQQSLSQSEVDAMLEFYRSEAGEALVAKMPVIMQNTMVLMQQRMANMAPRMQQIQEEARAKLQGKSAQ
tara:strand:- start:365 stop:868 length:504 start_codon:yes stop_codon:yes gene_type:complete